MKDQAKTTYHRRSGSIQKISYRKLEKTSETGNNAPGSMDKKPRNLFPLQGTGKEGTEPVVCVGALPFILSFDVVVVEGTLQKHGLSCPVTAHTNGTGLLFKLANASFLFAFAYRWVDHASCGAQNGQGKEHANQALVLCI